MATNGHFYLPQEANISTFGWQFVAKAKIREKSLKGSDVKL
jgi:hypothetical protein